MTSGLSRSKWPLQSACNCTHSFLKILEWKGLVCHAFFFNSGSASFVHQLLSLEPRVRTDPHGLFPFLPQHLSEDSARGVLGFYLDPSAPVSSHSQHGCPEH